MQNITFAVITNHFVHLAKFVVPPPLLRYKLFPEFDIVDDVNQVSRKDPEVLFCENVLILLANVKAKAPY